MRETYKKYTFKKFLSLDPALMQEYESTGMSVKKILRKSWIDIFKFIKFVFKIHKVLYIKYYKALTFILSIEND